ncbi:hypothetical protein PVAND_003239 [Polypedilum vanderplanki]|uniref:Fanconi anemia group M protein n=1 Tax=Polypedilum vanderplanki TaxID=319348 RepID=A0A9J6BUI4_POLVA|nr:hypothetical protein PVAND_003239 [Polypedilum vanderplanki]
MATAVISREQASEDEVQREINEVNALLAQYDEEEDASWLAELNLNNSNNQSVLNASNGHLVNNSVCDGFDVTAGSTWLFPTSYEKREYQLNISRSTLFYNTLVILPTGLGKTLIASVTIYNFFRWFPKSKIIFMAPTRPLVNQQISACYKVVGIPKEDTAELTGKINKDKRKEYWNTKRVFFATPQVVQSDLAQGILPTNLIKLLIFDEAHKAKGEYAYCKVINEVLKVQNKFRVLALTATAGKTNNVIDIVKNLIISKIEYRSEQSIDVRRYSHQKVIETIAVKITPELKHINDFILDYVDPMIQELRQAGFVKAYNLSKGYLIMEQNKIKSSDMEIGEKNTLLRLINEAVSFYHSLEILQRHSVHLFLKSLKDEVTNKYKYFIVKDFRIVHYIKELERKYDNLNPLKIPVEQMSAVMDKDIDFGHPKFDILKNKTEEYFRNGGSKAIIFCEYRDTTELIFKALLQLRPLVKPKCLIGQGGNMSQKEQLKIMKDFREADTNTLICTCVAEEGLDIGEVDLVICFDIGSKNSTRFVQRIGRTARKRSGKVIVLATEGRELDMIKELVATKDSMNKSISRSKDISKYFYTSPRLVPKEFEPQCIETKFVIGSEKVDEEEGKKKKGSTKGKKVKASSSKESITNHFKPTSKGKKSETKSAIVISEDEIEDKQLDIDKELDEVMEVEPCIERDEKNQDYGQLYLEKVNQFIKDNQLEDNKFLRDLIDDRAREGVDSLKRLAKMLESPPKKEIVDINFNDITDNLCLSPTPKNNLIEMDEEMKDNEKEFELVDFCHDNFNRYGNQFNVSKMSSPFIPVITKFNESIEHQRQIEKNLLFATPDFSQFQRHQRKISASTPLCGRNLTTAMHDIFKLQNDDEESRLSDLELDTKEDMQNMQPQTEKFPFLGINSISDIFEGCETNNFSSAFVQKNSTSNLTSKLTQIKSRNWKSEDKNVEHITQKSTDDNSFEKSQNDILEFSNDDTLVQVINKSDSNNTLFETDCYKNEKSIEDSIEKLKDKLNESSISNSHCSVGISKTINDKSASISDLEKELINYDTQDKENSLEKYDNIEEIDKSFTSISESEHYETKEKDVFVKFNLNDINDLFGEDVELSCILQDKNILEENISSSSDKTVEYDFESEMTKIENNPKSSSSNKSIMEATEEPMETEQDDFKENNECSTKSIIRPNITNFMSVIKNNSFGKSATQNVLKTQNQGKNCVTQKLLETNIKRSDTVLLDTSINKTPPIKRTRPIALQNDSPETPIRKSKIKKLNIELSDTSDTDCIIQTPISKKNKKKRNGINSFFLSQADHDDDDSSEEDDGDHDSTTLRDFVVDTTIRETLSRTNMQLQYLQSLRSPNAPINRKILSRPLNPMNFSQIYSQAIQESECEDEESDDLGSFIVKTDDEIEQEELSEIDELELAEKALKRKRQSKKNENGNKSKTSKVKRVIRPLDSSSEDEDMRQLRREVDM